MGYSVTFQNMCTVCNTEIKACPAPYALLMWGATFDNTVYVNRGQPMLLRRWLSCQCFQEQRAKIRFKTTKKKKMKKKKKKIIKKILGKKEFKKNEGLLDFYL